MKLWIALLVYLFSINTYVLLAWEVPSDFLKEVKENYWEVIAKEYKEYGEYFTSLVKERKKKREREGAWEGREERGREKIGRERERERVR